ncbi:MAG: hypothetical protein ACRC2T_15925 [Thermoguttaceae bacterium]
MKRGRKQTVFDFGRNTNPDGFTSNRACSKGTGTRFNDHSWYNVAIRFLSAILICVGVALLFSGNTELFAQDIPSQKMDIEDVKHALNDRLGKGINPNGWRNFIIMTTGFAIIGGVVLVVFLLERHYHFSVRKESYNNPRHLFRELCSTHEFSRKQSRLLSKVAKELQLENPLLIFVEPKYLNNAIEENIIPGLTEDLKNIYHELYNDELVSKTEMNKHESSWFAWTEVSDNPNAAELVRETKRTSDTQGSGVHKVQDTWNPSMFDEINRIATGSNFHAATPLKEPHTKSQKDKEDYENVSGIATVTYHQTAPPDLHKTQNGQTANINEARNSTSTISANNSYKPQYPDAVDAVGMTESNNTNANSTNNTNDINNADISNSNNNASGLACLTPTSTGSQILSTLLSSVSDVSSELAASSIRNHLTRSLSLTPSSLREVKYNPDKKEIDAFSKELEQFDNALGNINQDGNQESNNSDESSRQILEERKPVPRKKITANFTLDQSKPKLIVESIDFDDYLNK